jgi:signal transduction histidine kinase
VGSVRDLVRQTVSFILAGSQVQPVFDLGRPFAANFDASQIEQVIQNLAVNAKQAMPGGGRLLVCTRDFVDDDGRAFVELTIADEGSGISPEDLDKLFDPYFTTKPGGTGLGLAVVHSVVSRHNGYITVDSVPGEGTTFRVYLPAAEGELEAQESSEADPGRVQALQGRALVVDDEEPFGHSWNVCWESQVLK